VKFARDRFPPGFFDLPRDAGDVLPLDVIERWTTSPQTREVARAILAPHTLQGTVVSSDSAGLTRLTRERPLVEILMMVSRPKELVHAWGSAIGGRALGVWAADNTQMFYGESVDADRVVGMLLAVLDQVREECEVQIGLCAHHGQFFELAGGVYGPDADRVEVVAEEHTDGGELVITDTLAGRLAGDAFTLTPRQDLARAFGGILRVEGGPRLSGVTPEDFHYPAPYSDEFYKDLARTKGKRRSMLPKPMYQQAAVVLIEREAEDRDIPEVAALNDLALTAAMKRIGGALLPDLGGTEIKNAGLIGIYTFAESRSAVAFAEEFRRTLAAQGIQCRIGVDQGQVLTFDLGSGKRDIAGSPVNIASKLAQDVGELGSIYVSEAAFQATHQRVEASTRRMEVEVSGVRLGAVVL
jgi:adenylate/guanylate cyclase family protein